MTTKRKRHRSPSLPLLANAKQRKATAYRKIIAAGTIRHREYHLHATKGWRCYRAPA